MSQERWRKAQSCGSDKYFPPVWRAWYRPGPSELDASMTFKYQDQVHKPRVVVVRTEGGWEVRELQDEKIIRVVRHADWHRVERSVLLFERKVS
jgi:hypothetical protein